MMNQPGLAAIDRRTVAARFTVEGRPLVVRGRGVYEHDADLGCVLRIRVDDPSEDFELVLVEALWTGIVETGDALGCEYLLHL